MTELTAQTIAAITTIGALVVPPIVSLLKKENWNPAVKQLIAGVLSLGVAAAGIALTAPSDFALPLLTLGALVYAGSQVIYGAFFQGSSVETLLRRIGNKKSVPSTVVIQIDGKDFTKAVAASMPPSDIPPTAA